MPSLPRLTEMAHSLVAMWLQPGDYAIDATAGNGHDTVMLASLTGPKGHVLAVDIQPEGLENTRRRLEEQGLLNSHIQLVQGNHAELQRITPKNWAGKVRVIMFNLGFRPHAEIPVATRLVSTLSALGQSLGLLAEGGLLTLILYRVHDGGEEETQAILEWACGLDDTRWHVARYDLPNIRSRPPILLAITRRRRKWASADLDSSHTEFETSN